MDMISNEKEDVKENEGLKGRNVSIESLQSACNGYRLRKHEGKGCYC